MKNVTAKDSVKRFPAVVETTNVPTPKIRSATLRPENASIKSVLIIQVCAQVVVQMSIAIPVMFVMPKLDNASKAATKTLIVRYTEYVRAEALAFQEPVSRGAAAITAFANTASFVRHKVASTAQTLTTASPALRARTSVVHPIISVSSTLTT